VLLTVQRPQEALPHLLHALEVYPDYGTSQTMIGDAYLMLGEMEIARLHYEQAIQINPFDPRPHQYLAEGYLQTGDAVAAQREARVVRQLLGK